MIHDRVGDYSARGAGAVRIATPARAAAGDLIVFVVIAFTGEGEAPHTDKHIPAKGNWARIHERVVLLAILTSAAWHCCSSSNR